MIETIEREIFETCTNILSMAVHFGNRVYGTAHHIVDKTTPADQYLLRKKYLLLV